MTAKPKFEGVVADMERELKALRAKLASYGDSIGSVVPRHQYATDGITRLKTRIELLTAEIARNSVPEVP